MAFTVPFEGSPNSLVDKIKKAVNENKGNFTGDYNSGKIQMSTPIGNFHGSYKIEEHNITIEIIKKPFIISEEKIKKEILKLMI
jgi:hypothetical protein